MTRWSKVTGVCHDKLLAGSADWPKRGVCIEFARLLFLVGFVLALAGSLATALPDHLSPVTSQISLSAAEFDNKDISPDHRDVAIVTSCVAALASYRLVRSIVVPACVLTVRRISAGQARAPPSWSVDAYLASAA